MLSKSLTNENNPLRYEHIIVYERVLAFIKAEIV